MLRFRISLACRRGAWVAKCGAVAMCAAIALGLLCKIAVDIALCDRQGIAVDLALLLAQLLAAWVLRNLADRLDAAIDTDAAG